MVTFVKSTYSGSSKKYAVSGVRVLAGPSSGGGGEFGFQFVGTNLEFDIPVDYDVASSIQAEVSEVDYVAQSPEFNIKTASTKDLMDELHYRFRNSLG